MVHRDISLGNILVSEKDPHRAFLIDFGLSQWLSDDESEILSSAGEVHSHHVVVSRLRRSASPNTESRA